MDFSLSDEERELKEAAIAFAEAELGGEDEDGVECFSREKWLKCAEYGIHGLPFPTQYGGSGLDPLKTALVMEGLGYGCRDTGLIFAVNAQMWSVQMPILTFGTELQKEEWLPRMVRGEVIGAHGVTEPGAGSDAYGLETLAERTEGGYTLNGTKTLVTSAPVADLLLVFATVNPDAGLGGITAFLVPADSPGITITRTIEKMGLNSAVMGEFVLDDCFVSEENRLGSEGSGASLFNHSMEWERGCLLASQVGRMERQLEACIRFARDRRQFGQSIGKFQSVSNRIADMKVRLEAARLLVYKVAWMKKQRKPATLEAAIVKLFLSEAFLRSSEDSVRLHGGSGYTVELGMERDVRDALGGVIYSGTSDLQRVIIARLLGL